MHPYRHARRHAWQLGWGINYQEIVAAVGDRSEAGCCDASIGKICCFIEFRAVLHYIVFCAKTAHRASLGRAGAHWQLWRWSPRMWDCTCTCPHKAGAAGAAPAQCGIQTRPCLTLHQVAPAHSTSKRRLQKLGQAGSKSMIERRAPMQRYPNGCKLPVSYSA